MRTIFLILAFSTLFISCENEDEKFHKITYRVEGNFSILDSLFYKLPVEGLQKQGATKLNWEYSFWATKGDKLMLKAGKVGVREIPKLSLTILRDERIILETEATKIGEFNVIQLSFDNKFKIVSYPFYISEVELTL